MALILHLLIGDYLTGGVQLLWPVSMSMYGIGSGLESISNIALELVLFVVYITVMFKTKDVFSLFNHNPLNMILSIPLIAVLLPTVISYPLRSFSYANSTHSLFCSFQFLYFHESEIDPDKKMRNRSRAFNSSSYLVSLKTVSIYGILCRK